MENRLMLKEGTLTVPPENSELINGCALTRPEPDDRARRVMENLTQCAKKDKLTNKPLDTVHEAGETYTSQSLPATVLFPPFSVSKKGSGSPDWVADFVYDNKDPNAFYVKPWVYMDSGVTEYWLFDVRKKKLYLYNFEKKGLIPEVIDGPRRIKAGIYSGLYISYSDLFAGLD